MHNQEKEVLSRLKEHRSDQLEILKVSDEERREMYKMKAGTVEGEIEFVRNVMKKIERRMDEEKAF